MRFNQDMQKLNCNAIFLTCFEVGYSCTFGGIFPIKIAACRNILSLSMSAMAVKISVQPKNNLMKHRRHFYKKNSPGANLGLPSLDPLLSPERKFFGTHVWEGGSETGLHKVRYPGNGVTSQIRFGRQFLAGPLAQLAKLNSEIASLSSDRSLTTA
jgi:hypothetical protein